MRSDRYRPNQPPYLLYGLLGASLVLNIYMVFQLGGQEPAAPVAEVAIEAPAAVVAEAAPAVAAPVDAEQATPAQAAQELGDAQPPVQLPAGYSIVQGSVQHSLARTFQNAAGDDADALSAVFSRLFAWDLNLRRDVQKGDQVWVAYRTVEGQEPEIAVAWYKSQKLGKTLKAYRYQAPGDTYASYWTNDGDELAYRIVGGPIEAYEQITSLLKDRPTHKGMDFKAPVGTPVVSPKAGTVTRVNWNHAANGNCVEVRFPDGTLAKFLHLDKLKVAAGQHVRSGQVLAASGNTGRSTAPHLHYQLDRGGKTLDPLDYHDTARRKLDAQGMSGLQAVVDEVSSLFAVASL